jgi:translation initiation factor 2B subunit (eIF-2B alpha/beta/delta family)
MQAVNYATASLGHALKLQDELDKAKAELAEAKKAAASLGDAMRLQDELEKAKTELAEAKKAAAAEVESAKAAAVQEAMKKQRRRLVEEALKGYERGLEDMKRVALKLRPDIDPARLNVPPGGFR